MRRVIPLASVGALIAATIAIGVSGHQVNAAKCMARPAGVPLSKCSAVCGIDPSGKPRQPPCDMGADNAMQPGQWADNGGCVEVPCSVVAGDEEP